MLCVGFLFKAQMDPQETIGFSLIQLQLCDRIQASRYNKQVISRIRYFRDVFCFQFQQLRQKFRKSGTACADLQQSCLLQLYTRLMQFLITAAIYNDDAFSVRLIQPAGRHFGLFTDQFCDIRFRDRIKRIPAKDTVRQRNAVYIMNAVFCNALHCRIGRDKGKTLFS